MQACFKQEEQILQCRRQVLSFKIRAADLSSKDQSGPSIIDRMSGQRRLQKGALELGTQMVESSFLQYLCHLPSTTTGTLLL